MKTATTQPTADQVVFDQHVAISEMIEILQLALDSMKPEGNTWKDVADNAQLVDAIKWVSE